ncbi:MAG: NAD(P)-dependent oxidoreductase [Hyphomicrobiaceae bacterium]
MTGTGKEMIGLVGAGRMGLAMLKHLAKHGYGVTVCDISQAQCELAKAAGASIASSPAELGRSCSFVIIGVGFDDEVRAVMTGADGLLAAMQPGGVIAISSTASPETVKGMDEAARANGLDVYDAPIARGRWAADNGTLLALVGGRPEVVARAAPVYSCFCSDIVHLGDVGHGQVGKTMNNLMLWISAVGLIEAGRLAETTGISLPKLREALQMSSGRTAALEDWDGITFTWALKDMQIVAEMADKAGLSLPLCGAIKEMVKEARRVKASNPPDWTGRPAMSYEAKG